MTQEEKAKAYDRVSKEVKDFFEGRQKMYSDINKTLEYLFPELAESEDKRIRKELLSLIEWSKSFAASGITTDEANEMTAWLEKQGGTFTKKDVDDAYLKGISDAKDELEKQDEQKSSIEVKPKFKVGDWITNGATKPAQISSIEDDMYYTHNGTIGGDIESMDKDYHLWTIADARDGDVLVLNNEVFIYAHRKQMYSIAVAHCFVDSAGSFYLDGEFGYKEYGKTIYLATKEQRDTLMKAMADAGWEFDFEKKELKKVEQKPAWSEEDEHRINDIIYFLDTAKKHYASTVELDACIDWIKSLKERLKGE